jgi:hypothetical protein
VNFGNSDGRSCGTVISANKAIYSFVASGKQIFFNKITSGAANDGFNVLIVFPYVANEDIALPD